MRGKRQMVGLSIGSRKSAIAEVYVNTAGTIEVKNLGVTDTAHNGILNGEIADSNAVLQSIQEILSKSNISGLKQLTLSIEDDLTNTRLITMPSMSKNETLESLTNEVEDYAVLSGDKPALDFYVTRRTTKDGVERMEVSFVVASEELVNSYLRLVGLANLKPIAMETIPLAVLRAYTNILRSESQPETPVMLVIIEEDRGMIIILQDKTVMFLHDIGIGNKDLHSSQNIDELNNEIKASLNYFQTTFPKEGSIEKIILFIDNMEEFNIANMLGLKLGLSVNEPQLPNRLVDKFENDIRGNILSVCAAIGSALYAISGRGELSINLIPPKKEVQKTSLRARAALLSVPILTVILLFAVASVILKYMANSIEQNLIIQKQQEIIEVPNQTELKAIEESIAQLKARIDVTDAAMNSIKWSNCANLLRVSRAAAPGSLWLTRLTWQEDKNVVFGGFALSYDAVFKFRRSLIESPYLDPVKLIFIRSTDILGQQVNQFEIQCGVKEEIFKGGLKIGGSS